jgi:tetraacyldisaccharide 4'-kinase
MHLPDQPSVLRRLALAPAALTYAVGTRLHRVWMLWNWRRERGTTAAQQLPLIVIGSLRAGGAGKTPVTRELARYLDAKGLRVGVLAYSIHGRDTAACSEIFPDSDWRASSDEAVFLARELADTGARVFAVRHRARAREALARGGTFDVLVSDDGLMDPRLESTGGAFQNTFRVALARPDENPGWMDLLPAGPYRLTARALRGMDRVLREGQDYAREPVPLPHTATAWNAEEPHWVLCGLGSPPGLLRSLKDSGIRIAGISAGPDHGLPNPGRARRKAARVGVERFLCTEKDWIKLESHPARPPLLFRIGERVTLSPDFLGAVERFLTAPTS